MLLLKYALGVHACGEVGFRRSTDLQEAPTLCRTLRQHLRDAQPSRRTSVHILIGLQMRRFKHEKKTGDPSKMNDRNH